MSWQTLRAWEVDHDLTAGRLRGYLGESLLVYPGAVLFQGTICRSSAHHIRSAGESGIPCGSIRVSKTEIRSLPRQRQRPAETVPWRPVRSQTANDCRRPGAELAAILKGATTNCPASARMVRWDWRVCPNRTPTNRTFEGGYGRPPALINTCMLRHRHRHIVLGGFRNSSGMLAR